jgi:hypothetical protein
MHSNINIWCLVSIVKCFWHLIFKKVDAIRTNLYFWSHWFQIVVWDVWDDPLQMAKILQNCGKLKLN